MSFKVEGMHIEFLEKKPKVKKGRLVQGLLGVGQVGLMAARQIIDNLGAKKIAHVYSDSFLYPGSALPGIVYDEDNYVDMHRNEIYFVEENELFILTGIYQGTSPESYYRMAEKIVEFCKDVGVKRVYTLGGYGVGEKVEEPTVRGVVYSEERERELEEEGIKLLEAPAGTLGATGMAGLLIPMGERNGLKTLSLLSETHGNYPDPRASKESLKTLSRLLDIEIGTEELDEQIETMEKELSKMEEYAKQMSEMYQAPKDESLQYIG